MIGPARGRGRDKQDVVLQPWEQALLVDYYLFHATRAELFRDLGRHEEGRAALARALELTTNPAERALLQRRLG